VTDAGLKELAGLKSLQRLNLSGTQVTDAGLKELAGLISLQILHLDNTQVTNVGIDELRKALPGVRIQQMQEK
jgi:internalin A